MITRKHHTRTLPNRPAYPFPNYRRKFTATETSLQPNYENIY